MQISSRGRSFFVAATWGTFAVLALFWTGAAWLAAWLAEWAAASLASGAALEAGRSLATLPVPQWLALWVDTAWLQALQSTVTWALELARDGLPFLGSAAGWLVPLVWMAWGVGLVAMLVAAGGAHLLMRRLA